MLLEVAAESMILAEPNDWEAAFFGCPVIQLSLSAEAPLGTWLEARPAIREYIVARVPTGHIALIHALEQHGFRLLVPMVMLESGCEPVVGMAPTVAPAVPQDVPHLAEIARHAFVHGRFSAELELSREVVGEMYATWARNCCNGTLADKVLVIHVKGRPVGFIAVRRPSGEVSLIAVAPAMQGRGIGSSLVGAARRGGRLFAWTPLTNIPAIQMYEKCGFRMRRSSLYYRLWRPE